MEISEINWIDGALSAVLLASTVFGLFRGLIRGVFGIASLIVAFFVARRYGEYTGRAVSSLLGESAFVFALGYVLVFVTAMLAFAALTYLIRRAAARVDLGAMDKFGGLLFGVLRGGVFGALIVAVLASLPLQKSAAWNESVLLPMFGYAMEFAVGADALGGYGRYWRFDGEHRPRL
ncbi:MAG: CvpA family protein, partial [Gammaproteobacteria bacterium]